MFDSQKPQDARKRPESADDRTFTTEYSKRVAVHNGGYNFTYGV